MIKVECTYAIEMTNGDFLHGFNSDKKLKLIGKMVLYKN